MTMSQFLKLYAASLVVCFGLDLLWLGVFAKNFYDKQMGHLLRPDTQWVPAVLFYLIYVAAMIIFVVQPAIEEEFIGARDRTRRVLRLRGLYGVRSHQSRSAQGLSADHRAGGSHVGRRAGGDRLRRGFLDVEDDPGITRRATATVCECERCVRVRRNSAILSREDLSEASDGRRGISSRFAARRRSYGRR